MVMYIILCHYSVNFTAKCASPIRSLNDDSKRLVIADYSHPAIEGTNVSFSCPPGLVLTGPSTSMCMGNGEWEPDPSQVNCIGKVRSTCTYTHNTEFMLLIERMI